MLARIVGQVEIVACCRRLRSNPEPELDDHDRTTSVDQVPYDLRASPPASRHNPAPARPSGANRHEKETTDEHA
jgi:hypothetical protein